jgi:hypothetical protein
MFDPNTVYFGKSKARGSYSAQLDCPSNAQAKLIVRLANAGVSGWVKIPNDEGPCLATLEAIRVRLEAARKRFDELANSRTSDPRIQAEIVALLTTWFVCGRTIRGTSEATPAD